MTYRTQLIPTEFTEILTTKDFNTTAVSGSNTLTATGLEENVEYSVRVQAINGVGPSPFSDVVNGITSEDSELIPIPRSYYKPYIGQ